MPKNEIWFYPTNKTMGAQIRLTRRFVVDKCVSDDELGKGIYLTNKEKTAKSKGELGVLVVVDMEQLWHLPTSLYAKLCDDINGDCTLPLTALQLEEETYKREKIGIVQSREGKDKTLVIFRIDQVKILGTKKLN